MQYEMGRFPIKNLHFKRASFSIYEKAHCQWQTITHNLWEFFFDMWIVPQLLQLCTMRYAIYHKNEMMTIPMLKMEKKT